MKKYNEPKLDIIVLKVEDILQVSGLLGGDNLGNNEDFI